MPINTTEPQIQTSTSDYLNSIKPVDIHRGESAYKSVTQNTPTMRYDKQFFEGNPNKLMTPLNFDETRENVAKNQTGWELAGKAGVNTFTELTGGLIEVMGTIGEGIVNPKSIIDKLTGAQDAFTRNFVEELGNNIIEMGNEYAPIYKTQDAREMNSVGAAMTDATFWTGLAPSIVSAATIFIPVMGEIKLLRLLNTVTRAGRLAAAVSDISGLSKVARLGEFGAIADRFAMSGKGALEYSNIINRGSKIAGKGNLFMDAILPAIASRNLDSMRSAYGEYDNTYNTYKDILGDKEAKSLAADTAHKGYLYSHANVIFDIVQWMTFSKTLGSIDKGLRGRIDSQLFKNSKLKELVGDGLTAQTFGSTINKQILSKFGDFAKVSMSEGFDETFMDFFMSEGKRQSLKDRGLVKEDNSTLLGRLLEHHKVAKNWESFIGGALGGVAMEGGVEVYHATKNKFFDKSEHKYIENTVNDFVESMSNTTNSIKEISRYMSNGDKTSKLSAEVAVNKLKARLLHESASSGNSELTIDALNNMANMDLKDPSLASFVNEYGLTKDIQNTIKEVATSLNNGNKLFSEELSKVRTGDLEFDRHTNMQIALAKTLIQLNTQSINKFSKDDVTPKDIDMDIQATLNNLPTDAQAYYHLNTEHNKNIERLETEISTLSVSRLTKATKLEHLRQEANALDTSTEHGMRNKISNLEVLSLQEPILLAIDKDIANKQKQVIDANALHEQTINSLPNKESYKDDVDHILNTEKQARNIFTDKSSLVEVLRNENTSLESDIKYYNSKDGLANEQKAYKAAIQSQNDRFISDFQSELAKTKTKEDVDTLLSSYVSNNKNLDSKINKLGSKEQITVSETIRNLAEKRKGEFVATIKNDSEKDSNVSNVQETIITPETTTEENILVEPETIVTSEVEAEQRISSTLASTGDATNIVTTLSNNNESFNIGDNVYAKSGKGMTQNTYPIKGFKGNKFVILEINGKDTDVNINNVSKILPGKFVDTELSRAIEKLSNSIEFNEATHKYNYKGDTVQNTSSASSLKMDEMSVEERQAFSESNKHDRGSDVGNQVDVLIRDFFTDKTNLKSNSSYGFTNNEVFDNFISYLEGLEQQFNAKGLKVLASNIKLFDKLSGVAGTIDLLLLDSNNNVYIYDIKTSKQLKTNKFFSRVYNLSKFVTQVNTYGYLLKKLIPNIDINIVEVGIIPIDVTYNNASTKSIVEISKIEPASLANKMINTKALSNVQIANNRGEIFYDTKNDNSIITFKPSDSAFDGIAADGITPLKTKLGIKDPESIDLKTTTGLNDLSKRYTNVLDLINNVISKSDADQNQGLKNLRSMIGGVFSFTNNADGTNGLVISKLYEFLVSNYIQQKSLEGVVLDSQYRWTFDQLWDVMFTKEAIEDLSKIYIQKGNTSYNANEEFTNIKSYLQDVFNNNELQLLNTHKGLTSKAASILENSSPKLRVLSGEILGLINNASLSVEKYDSLLSSVNDKVLLVQKLLDFKKYKTYNNEYELTFKDVITIVIDSYNIQNDSETNNNKQPKDLNKLLATLPNIFEAIKNDLNYQLNNILAIERTNSGNNVYIDTDKLITTTETIDTPKGKQTINREVENPNYLMPYRKGEIKEYIEWSDANVEGARYDNRSRYYNLLNQINAINIDSKYNKSDSSNYIAKVLNEYSTEQLENTSLIYTEINPTALDVEMTDGVITEESNTIHDVISQIKSNDNITLQLNSKNEIEVIHDLLPIPIAIMSNIANNYGDLSLANTNDEYIGFKDLINNPRFKTLLQTKFANTDLSILESLKQLYKHKLTKDSTNRSDKDKQYSKDRYYQAIKDIQNTDSEIFNSIRELIDLFNITNKDNNATLEYNTPTIEAVLNIMFYGQHINYIDSFKPSYNTITNNINNFDTITKDKLDKYNNTKSLLAESKTSKAAISEISMPSILIKPNKAKFKSIKDSITQSVVNGKSSVPIIIYKNGILKNAETGEIYNDFELSKIYQSGKEGMYMLIPSTDGRVSHFPLKTNTLEKSYTNVGDGADYNKTSTNNPKAIKWVTKTILDNIKQVNELVSPAYTYQVGARDNDIRSAAKEVQDRMTAINTTIHESISQSGLANIIIVGQGSNDSASYPYFSHDIFKSKDGLSLEQTIKFKSLNPETTAFGVDEFIFHKIVITEELGVRGKEFKAYNLTINPVKLASKYTKNGILDKESYSKAISSALGDLNNVNVDISSMNDNIDKAVANYSDDFINSVLNHEVYKPINNLLRQNKYDEKGKMIFANNESTFTDPITGVEYNNETSNGAIKYALDTDGLYNNVDVITRKDSNGNTKNLSNLDLINGAGLKIGIDLVNVTSIQKGIIENPLAIVSNLIQYTNPEVLPLANGVIELQRILGDEIKEDVTIENYGERNVADTLADIVPVSVSPSTINFRLTYRDRFIATAKSKNLMYNPFVTMIHEHYHAVLTSITEFSKLDDTTKKALIAKNNNLVSEFIESFENDFNKYFYKSDLVPNVAAANELLKIFGTEDITFVQSTINGFIGQVKNELERISKKGDNTEFVSDQMAQELFTYMTNPYIMSVLSVVKPSYNYERETTNETFLDKFIDYIIKMYNNIVNALGSSYNFKVSNENYTKIAKDILSDYYSQLNQTIKTSPTVTTETTDVIEPIVTEKVRPQRKPRASTILSSDLVMSDNSFIFTEKANYRDDNNEILC